MISLSGIWKMILCVGLSGLRRKKNFPYSHHLQIVLECKRQVHDKGSARCQSELFVVLLVLPERNITKESMSRRCKTKACKAPSLTAHHTHTTNTYTYTNTTTIL